MRVYKVKNYNEMSKKAASVLAAQIVSDPEGTLGLATGSTPVGAYGYLRKWYQEGILDFTGIRTMNLDEYKGISRENSQSYYYFMKENLFDHVNIKEENTFIPDGEREDADAVCREYEALIRSTGGVGLQLLGLGRNGHIGFNEPGTPFTQRTHKVHLTESTIEANKRFFEKEEDVPRYAYSMGLQSIMDAKEIVLIAFGPKKIHAIKGLVEGPITEEVPASILQKHPKVTVICDEAAAALLTK